jgi:uncharacterized protein YndB with AHSA1/START domain
MADTNNGLLNAARAEGREVSEIPAYQYVTYIESTAEKVWHALTDAELSAEYWGHSNVSDWQPGSRWEHQRTDGSGIADVTGTVLEATPPRQLAITFGAPGDKPAGGPSTVSFTIEPYQQIVRLTVAHDNLADRASLDIVAEGWPAMMANLKTLLETGHVLPQAPWLMHADLRAAQMAKNDTLRC